MTACGSTSGGSDFGPGSSGGSGDGGTTDDGSNLFVGGGGDASPASDAAFALPPNFVQTEHGGYALGAPLGDGGADAGVPVNQGGCSGVFGVVRDFKGVNETGGHPDFEAFSGKGPTTGLVANVLGADQKPVYASLCEASTVGGKSACPYGQQTTSKDAFDQWYRATPNVNLPYVIFVQFAPNLSTTPRVLTFESDFYFPLDGAGWGNSGKGTDGNQHNFGFTTEIHTEFHYQGGETFTFTGDDDVWVFMNGKLAIDLGGLHPKANATIDVDARATELGLVKGGKYPLDLFHAERHTSASDFRVDTNLVFTNCGTIPPDVPR